MSAALLVAKKELMILFRSPLAYVFTACFLFIAGYFFYSGAMFYEKLSMQMLQMKAEEAMSLEMVVTPYVSNGAVILLFLLPLLTMRSFAEEKRAGSFETLLSFPLTEFDIALGKLLAMAVFIGFMLALSAVSPLLLFAVQPPPIGTTLVAYLGLFLMALAFSAIGLFCSSLTESQIIAAASSFAGLLILWVLNWIKDFVRGDLAEIVTRLSLLSRFEAFMKGVIDAADVLYFLTLTAAFLFFTVLSLEGRRWRV